MASQNSFVVSRKYSMLYTECHSLLWLFGLAPSNPGLQELNNQQRYGHYIISKSDILEINCSSIALLEKCISQDTEPLQGAYDKI